MSRKPAMTGAEFDLVVDLSKLYDSLAGPARAAKEAIEKDGPRCRFIEASLNYLDVTPKRISRKAILKVLTLARGDEPPTPTVVKFVKRP